MDMLFIFRSWDEREPYPHELVIVRLMRGCFVVLGIIFCVMQP